MDCTICERMRFLRKSKNWTMAQAAENLGISKSGYQKYEYGVREVGIEMLAKIANLYNVSADYLLGRESAPNPFELLDLQTEINEDKVVEEYMQLPKEWRKILLEIMKQLADASTQTDEPQIATLIIQKHLNKASAGYGYDLSDTDEWEEVEVVDTLQARRADFAVEVEGDSMNPDFYDGELALIKKTPDISVGDVGLFIHDGQGFIKEYGTDCLISRNPEYDNVYGESYCVGVVIGKAELA